MSRPGGRDLKTAAGLKVRAYNLPDNVVFVVEVGDFPLHRSPAITEMLFTTMSGTSIR